MILMKYDIIIDKFGDNFVVSKNNKYGLINEVGKKLVPCKYEKCSYNKKITSKIIFTNKEDLDGCFDINKTVYCYNSYKFNNDDILKPNINLVVPFEYESLRIVSSRYLIGQKENIYYLIDLEENGKKKKFLYLGTRSTDEINGLIDNSVFNHFIYSKREEEYGILDIFGDNLIKPMDGIFCDWGNYYINLSKGHLTIFSINGTINFSTNNIATINWLGYNYFLIKTTIKTYYVIDNNGTKIFESTKNLTSDHRGKNGFITFETADNTENYVFEKNNPKEIYKFDNKKESIGSREDTLYYTTIVKDNIKITILATGCFVGNLEDFKAAVFNSHFGFDDSAYEEYMKVIKEIEK